MKPESIHIVLDPTILKWIRHRIADEKSKPQDERRFCNVSDYIRQAIDEKIRGEA